MKQYRQSGLFILIFSWLMAAPVMAQTPQGAGLVPTGENLNAGAVAAEVDQQREWIPEQKDVSVRFKTSSPTSEQSDMKIMVQTVTFSGMEDNLTEEELQDVVQADLGKEKSVADLWSMAGKVTDYLHSKGYMAALAILPPQEIRDGQVKMEILMGHYDRIGFTNQSDLLTERAVSLTHRIRPGKIIEKDSLDRTLLTLNDIPGLRAQAYLSPGRTNGTAELLFDLTTTEHNRGYVYTDNYGSRYTGRWRVGTAWNWNNISHTGDQLYASYLHSETGGVENYDIRYEIPVGNDGTVLGIENYRTDYVLGRQYSAYDAYGKSKSWKIFTKTPLMRTLGKSLYFNWALENEQLTDRIELFGTESEKHGLAIRYGFEGLWQGDRYATSARLTQTLGRMHMANDYAKENDYYKTAGKYDKTNMELYHIQRLNDRWSLHATLEGQYAWKNLDSSEKMYIGGYGAVRAFPQSEAGGDEGVLGSLEFRYQTGITGLQLAGFYDAGWVRYEKDPFPGMQNSRTLAGAGAGLIYTGKGDMYARLDYAYPLSDNYSEAKGKNLHGTWWFQLVMKI